jgi:hypothetical protein
MLMTMLTRINVRSLLFSTMALAIAGVLAAGCASSNPQQP